MSETVIKVENLSKQYRIGAREGYKTFRETLVDAAKEPIQGVQKLFNPKFKIQNPKFETFWALKDVSFEVKRGEVVGIIGRNGAGKTTLLKILSKITEPTEGKVELRGRVGSLLEVGTGFHPELTGHENVYLYGAILGMDRSVVTRKFDEIVSFAELDKFIDTPIKRYSTGMYMRLAFSVAAFMETEILLVDEVLAVGDAAFQKKCLGRMDDVAKQGRTVLFVSHNLGAINTLCEKSVYLAGGHLRMLGYVDEVIAAYTSDSTILSGKYNLADKSVTRRGDGATRFVNACLFDLDENKIECAQERVPFKIELGIEVRKPIDLRILSITLIDQYGNDLATSMHYDSLQCDYLNVGKYVFSATFDPNPLRRGTFSVRLACLGPNFHEYDHVHHAFTFIVAPPMDDPDEVMPRPGLINLDLKYQMKRVNETY